ncbi:MAG: DNA alkylation repair protein [Acidobacteria bacterium]|nr:DNA alkylation repair protein [Acidobacteriota bacterium]
MPFDAHQAARTIARALRAAGTPERAAQEKRYLKSDLKHFGTSVPETRRVVVTFARERPSLTRRDVIALVKALWSEPVFERRWAAVEMLERFSPVIGPRDIALVERLIRESRTWALVDGLAATVSGSLVERFPELGATLDRWARDEDFWVRRSALLALLAPLRRGRGDFERFGRYADAMLDEREFFVRKAIGWVLREAGKKRPGLVHAWLAPRAARASGLTVREAVKHLPEDMRSDILARAAGR